MSANRIYKGVNIKKFPMWIDKNSPHSIPRDL